MTLRDSLAHRHRPAAARAAAALVPPRELTYNRKRLCMVRTLGVYMYDRSAVCVCIRYMDHGHDMESATIAGFKSKKIVDPRWHSFTSACRSMRLTWECSSQSDLTSAMLEYVIFTSPPSQPPTAKLGVLTLCQAHPLGGRRSSTPRAALFARPDHIT